MGIFGDNDGERPSIRALTKQAKKADDPRTAAELLTEAGERAAESGKVKKALALLGEALEKAPDHGRASAVLESVLTRQGDDQALRRELARRLGILEGARGDARQIANTQARLAQTEERLGDFAAAFADYTRAFDLDPSQIGVAQAARRLAIQTERWTEALAIMEREIAVEPDHARRAELLRLRGRTMRDRTGQLDDAIQLLERAVRTVPGEVETRRELVETLLMRAASTDDPDRRSRDRYIAADILVDLVNVTAPEDQVRCVLEALDIAPEHLPALERLEELTPNDMELLLTHWERYVEAFPDGPKADEIRWRLGRESLAVGRADDGLRWIEELAKRDDLEAAMRAVELLDAGGRQGEARRWAKVALELCPDDEQLSYHRRLFDMLAPGDPVGAEHHALALLAFDPDDDRALELVIGVRSQSGDVAALAEIYADVCARSPRQRDKHLTTLGKHLEELGDVNAALVCFREAEGVLSGPAAADARSERVRLAELAGEWDELAGLLEEDARGLSPVARIPILEKLATMHRGLRADPTRATEALLSLLSIVNDERLTGVHRDLASTLESAGSGSNALTRAHEYARSAAPELRTSVFRILGRLHDAWGETELAADAWNLVRATEPEDEEALGRSVDLALAQERFTAAVELLEQWVRSTSGPATIALHLRIAEIAEEHLSDLDRAADAITTALSLAPDDRSLALAAAEALRRAERHGEEKIVLKVLLSSAPDADTRHTHQERLARLSAGALQDPDAALRVWTQLVNDTDDLASLEKLRDDARAEGDPARLDVILARLASIDPTPAARSEHALERAKVLALDLGRPQLGLRVLAHAAASFSQKHLPTLKYLESLASDAGDERMLARALEGQVELVDAARKRFVLRQLSELYDGALSENTGMVHALSRWEAVSPDEVDPILRLVPALAERGDWGGLLERLDKLIAISRKDAQKWIDLVAEAVTGSATAPEAEESEKARRKRDNARAWFLVEAAGRAEAPAQRLRLIVWAADRFEGAHDFQEAFTATTRALEMAGARPELLDRAERVAEAAAASAKLDGLYGRLVDEAPTEEDRVSLALRHAGYLTRRGRVDEAVDRLLRVSANAPTHEGVLEELERLAPKSNRLEEVLIAYVDRGNLIGGERAVHLVCRGVAVAYRSDKPAAIKRLLGEAVNQAGDDDALLDYVEAAAGKLGREGTEQLVRVYESRGNDPNAPKLARAKALVRAALRMREKLGLEEVAFGVLKSALALAPTEGRVLDAIEQSAVERGLITHLDRHLDEMVKKSTNRNEAAALVARQAKLYAEHLGQPNEAAEAYLRSISLNPDDEGVLRRLRFCLIETGRVQELIGLLERRLSRVDDEVVRARELRQLAKLWEVEAHNNWEAVDTWKRLLALVPDDPEAVEAISRLEKASRRPAQKPEEPEVPAWEAPPDTAVDEVLADTDELSAPRARPEEQTSRSARPPEMVETSTEVTAVSERPRMSPPLPPAPKRVSAKPPPVPPEARVRQAEPPSPEADDAETNERELAPSVAEAETAEIPLPPPSKPPPTKDGDLPSIIVDPDLLNDE